MCVLLFLSNTTRGNSSNDPTGFSSEGIDYFPLDYHHNSPMPNFILLKDNNRYANILSLVHVTIIHLSLNVNVHMLTYLA